jgi:hypothetical protein
MTIRNLPESVHRRLLNKARNSSRPFNELLQYYAMERSLYRLSKHNCREIRGHYAASRGH